jgi:hypothetical protein
MLAPVMAYPFNFTNAGQRSRTARGGIFLQVDIVQRSNDAWKAWHFAASHSPCSRDRDGKKGHFPRICGMIQNILTKNADFFIISIENRKGAALSASYRSEIKETRLSCHLCLRSHARQ